MKRLIKSGIIKRLIFKGGIYKAYLFNGDIRISKNLHNLLISLF